jgi:hypothetical protein
MAKIVRVGDEIVLEFLLRRLNLLINFGVHQPFEEFEPQAQPFHMSYFWELYEAGTTRIL